jgi:hypothetical protein
VALVALVAGGLWWAGRDTAREVTLDEAAARTSTTGDGTAPPTSEGPVPGIYRYEGSGTSSLSVPPLSQDQGPSIPGTVEVGGDGCWTFRVDYSTNHWQSWRYCPTARGLIEEGGQTWQRWQIGPTAITNLTEATCDEGLVVLPDERVEGDERDESCTATNEAMDGEVTSEGTFTYLGDEELDVGGTSVATAHFERRRELSGSQSGTERTEVWFAIDTGLPIRNERDLEVRTDTPAGESTYRESGTFQLVSLDPA